VRTGIWVLVSLAVIVGVLAGAFFGLTRRFTAGSNAMEPEVKKGDHVAVFRFSDSVVPPTRKDVVVLSDRTTPGCSGGKGTYSVERIIGLPGETVTERSGLISIDGKALAESYVAAARRDRRSGTWHVPKGAYLVLGDNRRSPCASPYVVPKKNVVGFVIFTYWPTDRISVGQ
jgi:signal peptidase I